MIKIIALTDAGLALAKHLHHLLSHNDESVECVFKPKPFADYVQQAFQQGERLILICATGIAVRSLAPVLQSKLSDPPVLVLDERAEFVIPLVSGHEGGANEWGRSLAELLNAQLVLTTANSYLKPVYTVGMGCERGCPKEQLKLLLDSCLAEKNLVLEDIASINSIQLKADEVGLIELSNRLNKPYQCFSSEQLNTVENLLSQKSDYVFSVTGVYGVAESAALYAAKQLSKNGFVELVLPKQKTKVATCAIARVYTA